MLLFLVQNFLASKLFLYNQFGFVLALLLLEAYWPPPTMVVFESKDPQSQMLLLSRLLLFGRTSSYRHLSKVNLQTSTIQAGEQQRISSLQCLTPERNVNKNIKYINAGNQHTTPLTLIHHTNT
mmetsp:Transcript_5400/g.6218  ORF Transcript_5400/g.6218 Transcript_5400/m.6218 type:complete len:124 (-) Transcript_5400:29-400(-)